MKTRIFMAAFVAMMLAGCSGERVAEISDAVRDRIGEEIAIGTSSEPDSPENAEKPGDEEASGERPDTDPCDGSKELEEVVRHMRPDQFPDISSGEGSWRGVNAADDEEINSGSGHCSEDYAFGFLVPKFGDGEFNWVVVAHSDWETKLFPTDLECADGDAVRLSEPPEVEEVLCSTGEEYGAAPEADIPEPTESQYTETETDAPSDANIEEQIGDYYRAAGAQEWAYTYDHLAPESRDMFTEAEWAFANQSLWDANPLVYHINSITPNGSSSTEVELRITDDDGSVSERVAYFLFEDGGWRHLLSDTDLEVLLISDSPADGNGVCAAGVVGCELMDTADIDGDGSLDEVALVEPEEYSGAATSVPVRVMLADGTTLDYDADVEFWSGETIWHGATDFGEAPGEEIVLGGSTGAHTLWFRVLTYRNGELVELPYPMGEPGAGAPYDTLWAIDSALSVYIGAECRSGEVVLRSVSSVEGGGEGGFEGEETRWVLGGDGWAMVGSEPLAYPNGESASEIYGWKCGDLPRGYEGYE